MLPTCWALGTGETGPSERRESVLGALGTGRTLRWGWRMADGGRKTLVLKSCFDLGWTIGRWTLTRIPNGRILRIFHSSRSCRVTNSSIHFHPLFSRGSIQHSILSSFSLPVAPTVPRLFPLLEKGDPDSLTVSLAPQLVRGPRRSASGQMSEETEGARIVNDDG